MLPAITLDVEPTDAGTQLMAAELAAFAEDHELPPPVASRMVAVASGVAAAVVAALAAPPLARLQADADIGLDDAQLVVIAGDDRLRDVYPSLKAGFDVLAARCDAFAAELAPTGELQVWARFRFAMA